MVKLGFGNSIYHFIGNRRISLGKFTAKFMPWCESSGKTSKLATVVVLLCFSFCFYINIQSLMPKTLPKESEAVTDVKRILGLWQKWSMFAPKPTNHTRWPIFEGTTNSGGKVDVFRHQIGLAATSKPEHLLQEYTYYRWRKYFERIYAKKYSYLRKYYVKYECNKWNEGKPHAEKIKEITLRMGIERTLMNKKDEKAEIRKMGTYKCK